jgi:pimeloyl-ACP methyl ester carboxylesterase
MTLFKIINNLKIGITEFGDPNGETVLYFHGFPGSRLDGNLFEFNKIGKASNTRIIGIDRPGIGISEFQPDRRLLDWPKTVIAIADNFNLKKFSILGISGGGPYALACAYAIPERLLRVSIISSMGPFNYQESMNGKAMYIPRQIGPLRRLIALGLMTGAKKDPEKLKVNIIKTLPEADIEYLSLPGKMDYLIEVFKECFKQGVKGYMHEAKLYRRNWGFRIPDIKTNLSIWHGTIDQNVSIELARRIASEIQDCKSTFIENEGHFSLTGKYLTTILNELTANTT